MPAQAGSLVHLICSAPVAQPVGAQAEVPNADSDAGQMCQGRTDRRAARHVAPHRELLGRDPSFPRQLPAAQGVSSACHAQGYCTSIEPRRLLHQCLSGGPRAHLNRAADTALVA